jgi:hypothetical protein
MTGIPDPVCPTVLELVLHLSRNLKFPAKDISTGESEIVQALIYLAAKGIPMIGMT